MKFLLLIPLVVLGCNLTDQGKKSPQYLDSVMPGQYISKSTCEVGCPKIALSELTLGVGGEMAMKVTEVDKETLDSCLISEFTGAWTSTPTTIVFWNGKGKIRGSCDQALNPLNETADTLSFPIRKITTASFEQSGFDISVDTIWIKWDRI